MSATVHTIWTVILMITVIGIYAWAWSPKRKAAFDEAANLALDDSNNNSKQEAAS